MKAGLYAAPFYAQIAQYCYGCRQQVSRIRQKGACTQIPIHSHQHQRLQGRGVTWAGLAYTTNSDRRPCTFALDYETGLRELGTHNRDGGRVHQEREDFELGLGHPAPQRRGLLRIVLRHAAG